MIYSLYKGDTFIGVGTAEELARMMDVEPKTISWMSGPTYKKRSGNSNRRLVVDKLGYDTDLDEEEKMDKYRFNKKELQRLIKRATYHMEHATVESAKKKWTLIKEKLETDPFRLGKDEIASIIHWERFSLRTAIGEDRKFKEALIEKLERMLI